MTILEMFVRCSMLTILCLAMIYFIAGSLFVLNTALIHWYNFDLLGEISKWITKHLRMK